MAAKESPCPPTSVIDNVGARFPLLHSSPTTTIRHRNGVKEDTETPKLFTPLTIRGVTFQSRLFSAPLCRCSAKDGYATDWHLTQLGGSTQRGPGLALDIGLREDDQIELLKTSLTAGTENIGIQLSQAGRKSSTMVSFLHKNPKEMILNQIEVVKVAFADATKRAVKAGLDVVEIHAAHGHLIYQFLSPISNQSKDRYGGSWENRLPEGWTVADSCKLAPILAERDADFLEVSSGETPKAAKYQMIVPAIGRISTAT
ncbi:uncharacterized protein NECHADRAFT_86093 [Fusarium vanettenii 77-13-4]|uniref:NADH:flavin oxidoreductase/NADH oxidase N-terminal domain-containing protein n=1 Tax=Fusarium vanettenii (strain ATCC MYA-4622 / CBS 123669 / FGSC 9596 / NRRL 45880 / 77-13-4) TaxID=660122 RepID=C7Z2B4_FUSV7|nr:uncharacterized protein NECHADRAFT_86093 [Fusarium vanettenii 77-13-4]EEU42143.1 hypothetical protein NECHADRAFT_86093 [Fusarium vanettenii 77-13-4]